MMTHLILKQGSKVKFDTKGWQTMIFCRLFSHFEALAWIMSEILSRFSILSLL